MGVVVGRRGLRHRVVGSMVGLGVVGLVVVPSMLFLPLACGRGSGGDGR